VDDARYGELLRAGIVYEGQAPARAVEDE